MNPLNTLELYFYRGLVAEDELLERIVYIMANKRRIHLFGADYMADRCASIFNRFVETKKKQIKT